MSRKLLFVINPKAGNRAPKDLEKLIGQVFKEPDFEVTTVLTPPPPHNEKLARMIRSEDWSVVVTAGGDGTIHQVGRLLVNSDIPLGILPTGSGNGLARHLQIPFDLRKGLEGIKNGQVRPIDVCYLHYKAPGDNSTTQTRPFFNIAGIGFDAYVARLFNRQKRRGGFNYIWSAFKAIFKYQSKQYRLTIDNKQINTSAYLIAFANASQYGINAKIAPQSEIKDGKLNVTIVHPLQFTDLFTVPAALFAGRIHHLQKVDTYFAQEITFQSFTPTRIHADGEIIPVAGKLSISIASKALKVLITK